MKTLSIAILLALGIAPNLSAQNFPLQGNEQWAYYQYQTFANPPGGCTIDTWKFYELKGDTILNGVKWYRMFQASFTEINCTYPTSHSESFGVPVQSGFLRDSADVWLYRDSESAVPRVLFSFGLAIGEPLFPNATCLVEQISATNTTPPRRIVAQVPPSNNGIATRLVEGIGSTYSFFFPECYSCYSSECQFAVNLKCFRQNGVEVIQNCGQSDMIYQKILDYQAQTPTQETGFAQFEGLRLTPNPGFDIVRLELPVEASFRVDIFDQMGKLTFSQAQLSSPEINVAAWKAGFYTLLVSDMDQGRVLYGRLVKM